MHISKEDIKKYLGMVALLFIWAIIQAFIAYYASLAW